MKQRIAVVWEKAGYVDVEADSVEESMQKVSDHPDDYDPPDDSNYVDGSFRLQTEDVDEMKEILGLK